MAPASSLESRAMLARIAAMSPNHHKTIACSTFASRPHVRVRLLQPARRLMTWGVTATHDSANLRPARWLVALRRTRLVLVAAAVAFGALWMLGTIAAAPALIGFAAISAAALLATVNIEAAPASLTKDEPSAAGLADPWIEALLSALPDPVIALDHRGDVVALNARAAAIAPALRPGESVPLGLRVPEALDAIRNARASGMSQRTEFLQRVPVERWYEAVATPISGSAPKRGLVLLAVHGLPPLRRVEEMRADFVANASHELRTPLAALSGFIDTLRGPAREDPAARDRFLGIMEAQANRMARLIGDLLSLSRIELNEHRRPDAEVDLVAIVRQVIDGLQTLARDREVEARLSVPSDSLKVRGDRDEL